MPPLNLKWKIWGRPVKPVSFALAIAMFAIFIANIDNIGILGDSQWGDFLGGLAFGVSVIFFSGWLVNSQGLTEVALLGALWVFSIRFWLIILVIPGHGIGETLWLDLAWMIVAGGSYLLEKLDSLGAAATGRSRGWGRH